jgi:transcriptional regulator with XRE-family HTH domain
MSGHQAETTHDGGWAVRTKERRIDGAKLLELREDRFLERRELAERSGVNVRTVQALELGEWKSGSRLSTIRKLAEALEVDPRELLAGEE